ncbi:MAG: hypothetical protein SGJ21_10775 [Alphaproteobacteria bacterium]|nr:hypothetical protein [Alphaproteobacteria bacterium]
MSGMLKLARRFVVLAAIAFGLGLPASPQASPVAGTPVSIGVYINDIQAIDLRTHTFVADLYIWFRDADPTITPGASFEFMNVAAPDDHVRTALYDAPQPQPDGSSYELFRHHGPFATKFSVRTYPFDNQELMIEIEDQDYTADRLRYVVDEVSINPSVQLPGYSFGEPGMRIISKAYPTAFGDLANPAALPYSRAIISIPIRRPLLSGVIKTFLPILIILLVAAAALVLDPAHVDARIGLSITALLTLVALQLSAGGGLPEVGYLLMLDQVYLASYAFILLVVSLLVRSTRVDDVGLVRGAPGALERLARGGPALAYLTTLAYLIVVGLIIILNLT